MSELTQLKDSVLAQANEKGQLKLERAQHEHAKEYQTKRDQLIHDKEALRRHKISELKDSYMRRMQQISNQQRLTSLNSKQQVLTVLFDGAVEVMNNWSSEEQLDFVRKILKKFEERELVLTFGELTKKVITETAIHQLKSEFPKVSIKDETIAKEGGFILTEDRIDFNYLYSKLVEATRNEINLEIAKEAFGTD